MALPRSPSSVTARACLEIRFRAPPPFRTHVRGGLSPRHAVSSCRFDNEQSLLAAAPLLGFLAPSAACALARPRAYCSPIPDSRFTTLLRPAVPSQPQSPGVADGRTCLFPSCLHHLMMESHTLRRLSLADSRVASRRPLPPRGCYATFADQDNALAGTVVWPPDSDLTLCTRLRTDRTAASSELARIDRRCHPSPFTMGQHQSQLADHAQRGPSPDFPGLLDRLPGGCHAADPSKTTSAAGLPPRRVHSSIRLDGH